MKDTETIAAIERFVNRKVTVSPEMNAEATIKSAASGIFERLGWFDEVMRDFPENAELLSLIQEKLTVIKEKIEELQ